MTPLQEAMRAGLRDALAERNVRAFLAVIRAGEGTSDPDGYRRHFGGKLFGSFADHPRETITAGGYTSTAAGAYQFLSRTWDGLLQKYGFEDFSPACQDEGAVALIIGRGALPAVRAGRLEEAIRACNREWASLPGSPYGQPTRTLEQARKVYLAAGGVLDAPGGEITKEGEPMLPLVGVLATALIEGFAPLVREKVEGTIAKAGGSPHVGEQITAAVVEAAKAATKVEDPIAAVAAAKADPQAMKAIESAALQKVDDLLPIIDKLAELDARDRAADEASRDAAARRAATEPWDMTRTLVYGMGGMISALILLVGAVALIQLLKEGKIASEVWAQVAGLLGFVTGVALTVYTYRFGTSSSSKAKDALMAAMVEQRRS